MIPHEIVGFFVHAQTVDTRPLFPPPTWPGYEANWYITLRVYSLYTNILALRVLSVKEGESQVRLSHA